jgi:hypothetical protein
VSATTFVSGKAGTIEIRADSVQAQDYSFIGSKSVDALAGSAGDIDLTARTVTLGGYSGISAAANGDVVVAGSITLDIAESLLITDVAYISTSTGPAFGGSHGGTIGVKARDVTLSNWGRISSTTQSPATGGNIKLAVSHALVLDNGSMFASVSGQSDALGGNIEASAAKVRLVRGSTMNCQATDGNAGNVILRSENRIDVDHSTIFVQSDHANAGTVILRAPESIVLRNSTISAQAGKDGGDIFIDPNIFGIVDTELIAKATSGNGGHIDIAAGFLYQLGNCPITTISENPLAQQGSVSIRSSLDFAGSLTAPSGGLADDSHRVLEGCARKNPRANSLMVRGKGGVAVNPDFLFPTFDLRAPLDRGTER